MGSKNTTTCCLCGKVKCSVITEDKFTLKLSWHHWVYYIFFLLGILPHLIVIPLVTKRAIIEVGLCQKHRKRREIDIRSALAGIFFSGAVIAVGLSAQKLEVGAVGVLLVFAGFTYLIVRSNVLAPKRIDSFGRVWLTGACREYLESLPTSKD